MVALIGNLHSTNLHIRQLADRGVVQTQKGAVSKFDQRLFGIRMERVLSEWFRW